MKKLLVLAVTFLLASGAYAQELKISEQLEKVPELKQGVAYSLTEHKIEYLSTIEVLNWKGITFEAGYSSRDMAVGVISYELMKLKDLGVTLPVLDLVEARVGVYAGYGRITLDLDKDEENNEFDYGLSLTLINIKF